MASATDNFPYSAGALSTVSSGAWATPTGAFGLNVISSNLVRATNGSDSYNYSYYTTTTFTGNHYSEIVATGVIGSDGGPTVRQQSGAVTCYFLETQIFLGTVLIRKTVAGSRTTLQDTGVGTVDGATYRLEVNGSTIRAYKNGVQMGTDVTDTDITGGQPGIFGRTDGVNTPDLSSWAAADVSAGGTVVPVFMNQYRQRSA